MAWLRSWAAVSLFVAVLTFAIVAAVVPGDAVTDKTRRLNEQTAVLNRETAQINRDAARVRLLTAKRRLLEAEGR